VFLYHNQNCCQEWLPPETHERVLYNQRCRHCRWTWRAQEGSQWHARCEHHHATSTSCHSRSDSFRPTYYPTTWVPTILCADCCYHPNELRPGRQCKLQGHSVQSSAAAESSCYLRLHFLGKGCRPCPSVSPYIRLCWSEWGYTDIHCEQLLVLQNQEIDIREAENLGTSKWHCLDFVWSVINHM
jgi:hypothetical protein